MLALVDLDGTLVDRDAGFSQWLTDFLAEHRLHSAREWFEYTDQQVKERGRFFTLVSERFPQVGPGTEVWADYRARMPELVPAFPGVREALLALRVAGWRLGVVTNGRSDTQLGKLRRTGLLDLFDCCCVSDERGLRKPDPAIFARARTRCGADGDSRCWMIGDDPELDIRGGRASGMSTIWVSHGRPWTRAYQPDRIAMTPAEALAALTAQ